VAFPVRCCMSQCFFRTTLFQQETAWHWCVGYDFGNTPARYAAGPKTVPRFLGLFVGNSGVGDIPRVAIIDEIDLDVVEPERQRHPRPEHARSDLAPFAGRGLGIRDGADGEGHGVMVFTVRAFSTGFDTSFWGEF
jgi:hypothetical protein